MALLHLDSFDHYPTGDWTKYTQIDAIGGGTTSIAAVGRRSTNGLSMVTNGFHTPCLRIVFPSTTGATTSGATAIWGFAFKHTVAHGFGSLGTGTTYQGGSGGTGANSLGAPLLAGAPQVWFKVNQSGQIECYRATTLLGTSTSALTLDTFQYLEFKVVINSSTGTVDVHVDGVSFMALTGKNTQNGASATWNEWAGPELSGTSGTTWYIDDLYVADGSGSAWNDFKGDTRVDATYPNADGNSSQFTRSTGANQYATVDEASANGDTDYNSTAVAGNKDTLNFPNAPVAGADIYGLQVVCQVKKTDAGSAGHKPVIRISGTDYDGTEIGVGSSYSYLHQAYDVKPSNSAAWTDTDYNAAEFGYKKST